MNIFVKWTTKWIYSDSGVHVSTVQKFLRRIHEIFQDKMEVVKSDLCSCELNLNVEEDVSGKIREILGEIIKNDNIDEICTVTVDGKATASAPQVSSKAPEVSAEKTEQTGEIKREESAEPEERPKKQNGNAVMQKISGLIGAEEFKALCREIGERADLSKKHNTKEILFSTAYILFLGRGCDLEDYAQLLGELFVEKGLFANNEVSLKSINLPQPPLGKSEISEMEDIADRIKRSNRSNAVVTFNINEWVSNTDNKYFKKLLQAAGTCEEKGTIFLFYCDAQPEKIKKKIITDFRDIILTKSVSIRELTDEELLKATEDRLGNFGFKLSEQSKALFQKKLESERVDGLFYGLKTIQKIVNEMIDAHETSGNPESDEITEGDMKSILETGQQETTAEKLLSRLYGMDSVKQQIFDICNQITYAHSHGIKLPCIHMKFVGNPGTGKTTMARIVGLILKEAGALRVGNFYEHHARDLCGQYIGQTAVITKEVCAQAYGSILFIDEAYALYRGADNDRDYGREAIDTLIAEMENHSDDLLVIFAGYPDEMDFFTNANPGLKSRIPFTIQFPNYSADELYYIFEKMVTGEFACNKEFLDAAKQHFETLAIKVKDDKTFGNARYVRNLYERVWGNAAKRAQEEGGEGVAELLPVDLQKAIEEMSRGEKDPAKSTPPRIGF